MIDEVDNKAVEQPEGDVAEGQSSGTDLPKTVGGVLRQAREAQGLSTEAVAEILRFSVRQIEHIENDNYQALPGATLVRGFIRGYAKFLRLDPNALIAQLDAAVPPKSSDVRPPSSIAAAAVISGIGGGSLRAILVTLVFLAIAVFGLYLFVEADEQVLSEVQSQLAQVNKAELSRADSPVSTDVPASPPVTSETTPAVGSHIEATTGSASAQTNAEPVVATSPTVGLLMEFDDLSWVEVRDATQAVVLVGEFPKGTRKEVDGKAPFSLWIGRASAVRISNQGRLIDLKSVTREDVARLTVE